MKQIKRVSELERAYINEVLDGGFQSAHNYEMVTRLEKAFAEKFQCKYAVAMTNGTATLHAALEAAGVGEGDEVIVPALTMSSTNICVLQANAIPVFADVDPQTFTLSVESVKEKITKRTKAVIPVSLYGLSADIDPIMTLAEKHGLTVIEDDAQAVLSFYKGKMLGTIGDISSFSFENTKHISCGEGGMIVTDREEYAERCRKLGGHGFKNLRAEDGRIRLNQEVFQDPEYKRHDVLGWNYRMPEFTAAVAFAQLERVDELVRLRQESAKIFMDVIKECDFLIPQETSADCVNSYYSLGVRYLGKERLGVSWQDFRKEYVAMGGDGYYGAWSVPYLEPMIANRTFVNRLPEVYENLRYEEGLCPIAECVQKQIMQIKTNYRNVELAKKKADIMYHLIRKYH